jgi:hypothetical protein
LIAVAVLGLSTAAFAEKGKNAPEKVSIAECKAKQPAVAFEHKKHFDERKIECAKCHHTQKDLKAGADVEVKKCASCHAKPEKAETPTCTDMSEKKNAYHIDCIGCHKDEVKKAATSKAPVKCKECHVK